MFYTVHMPTGKAIALPRSFFGPGKGVIWFDETGCRGNETKLIQCPHRGLGINNCRHIEDANVLCPGLLETVDEKLQLGRNLRMGTL